MRNQALVILFTTIAVGTKVGLYISGPLYLDSLRGNATTNGSRHDNATCDVREVDPLFACLSQAAFFTVAFGVILLFILLFAPNQITEVERNFPKKNYVMAGAANGISALILNYAMSGSRTPSYLLVLLGNFMVPSQFIVRFLYLRRLPTRRKLLCAVAVTVAEFVCLLPKIVPSLDPNSSSTSGGATGVAGVLWPLSFVIGLIPGTMNNAFMEKSVKDKREEVTSSTARSFAKINTIFFLFWYSLCFLLTVILLSWTDLIPAYGTVSSLEQFGERMAFNFLCTFGQRGCNAYVALLAWANMLGNWLACLGNAFLLRYSEGASFMIIAMTLRSPFLFLFWTLFKEGSRMRWHPHMNLSTILGIVALVVMIPAVHIYNTGAPERTMRSFKWGFWREENLLPVADNAGDSPDTEALLPAAGSSIQEIPADVVTPERNSRQCEKDMVGPGDAIEC